MSSNRSARQDGRAWDVVRRQVALCGRVTRSDGAPVSDVEVRIEPSSMPYPPVVYMRPDGIYFFLDLPAGEYSVAARDGESAGHGRGTVSWDPKGNVRAAVVDIDVTPRSREEVPGRQRHRTSKGRGSRSVS